MKKILSLRLSNYYGVVELHYDEDENKYYLVLENYDGFNGVEISEKLAKIIIEEKWNEKEIQRL